MFQVKEQEITDANTGVHVAFGRHDAVAAQPIDDKANDDDGLPEADRPAKVDTNKVVASPSQWMRITAGGKVSTVFFTPDGEIRNIQVHPKPTELATETAPGVNVDTDEAQPWKLSGPMVDEDFHPPSGSVPPVATPPIEG